MSRKKFVACGEYHNDYMLVQIGPGIGRWICIASGNRKNDQDIKLEWNHNTTRLGLWIDVVVEQPKSTPQVKKDDTVYFTRYIRPISYETGEIDNLAGVTIIIKLDYVNREVAFSYSICDGDNFCKHTGESLAIDRLNTQGCFKIDMPADGIPESGTVRFIIDTLAEGLTDGSLVPSIRQDAKKIVWMWSNAK